MTFVPRIMIAATTLLIVGGLSAQDSYAGTDAEAAISKTGIREAAVESNHIEYVHVDLTDLELVNEQAPVTPVSSQIYCEHQASSDCCYRRCSPFYGFVEGVFYDRTNTASNQLLVEDLAAFPPEPLVRVDDLTFENEPGVRAMFGWHLGPCHCCNSVEVGYLGIFNWEDRIRLEDPTGQLGVAGNISAIVNTFSFAEEVQLTYDSDLNTIEVNCVHCTPIACGRLEWLAGFRWLGLDENLDITTDTANMGAGRYNVQVDNDLYGGQVGVRARRWRGERFELEVTAKAGLYANDARQRQLVQDFNVPDVTAASSDTRLAFVGELNFTLIHPINDNWGVRGGYNLLWIEGLALAPDQLDLNGAPGFDPNFGTPLNGTGSLFAHGASVGFEATW